MNVFISVVGDFVCVYRMEWSGIVIYTLFVHYLFACSISIVKYLCYRS